MILLNSKLPLKVWLHISFILNGFCVYENQANFSFEASWDI